MKLRLQSNSIRLRLKRGEVEQLIKTGRVEEKIVFGIGDNDVMRYVLETSSAISIPRTSCQPRFILVEVPAETASRWAAGDDVGIETIQSTGGPTLQVLIEKDFACLNGPAEQNVDTFPNPFAGTKC